MTCLFSLLWWCYHEMVATTACGVQVGQGGSRLGRLTVLGSKYRLLSSEHRIHIFAWLFPSSQVSSGVSLLINVGDLVNRRDENSQKS